MQIQLEEGTVKIAQINYTNDQGKSGVYTWQGDRFRITQGDAGLPRAIMPLSTWNMEAIWQGCSPERVKS